MDSAVIAKEFEFDGMVFLAEPLGHGNVNDTYLVITRNVYSETRFILQRINKYVFKEPAKLMENMHKVTEHVHEVFVREQPQQDRIWQLPKVIPARSGKDYFVDEDGEYWRAISQIASAHSYEKIRNADHAQEVGLVLGHFHHAIADMSCDELHDTLPGFHITPGYLENLDTSLASSCGQRRLQSSKVAWNVLKFLNDRRDWCSVLEKAKASGELKMRPIHGDPKTANVMIDDVTGKGTSIIDLDTVKAGLIHYDIGDCLRSCCNLLGEETHEIANVTFNLDLCDALIKGYKSQIQDFITDADRYYLYDAVRLIAYEQTLRFFADYLAGDVYYKIREDGQNLLRARVQMQLCRSIEANESAIRRMMERI